LLLIAMQMYGNVSFLQNKNKLFLRKKSQRNAPLQVLL